MLRRLIYISQSDHAGDPRAVDAIVASANAWNAAHDVTGLLWTDGQHFAQVIEGKYDDVDMAMERIRADTRHSNIEVVLDRPVQSRQFGDWSMSQALDDESERGTTFMLGVAIGDDSPPAKRLHAIVLDSCDR